MKLIALGALAAWALVQSGLFAGEIVDHRDGAWIALATAGVMLLAALVSNIAGFAFCALAGSALAYLGTDPVRAVQAMVVCSTATQVYAVWTLRDVIRWRSLGSMIAAGTATIPLGVWLLVHVDAGYYAAALGAFLTAYGGYLLLRRGSLVVEGTPLRDAMAGALGGIAGGLAGLPGSIVTIWCGMRGWDRLRQRAVYQPYILAMQVVTVICLRLQALVRMSLAQDLRYVPFALLGALGGLAIFRRITNGQFRTAVGVLLAVSGVGLLARTW
ncbi:MAG TPA: sulfite exporter TauE/SafE family protein [Casimicrobiaceae bacterium]|nr:sulfite exporter TauE/SafE family protein [Casimicrobiaceae bacterium]